jgi:hypothetical protein
MIAHYPTERHDAEAGDESAEARDTGEVGEADNGDAR